MTDTEHPDAGPTRFRRLAQLIADGTDVHEALDTVYPGDKLEHIERGLLDDGTAILAALDAEAVGRYAARAAFARFLDSEPEAEQIVDDLIAAEHTRLRQAEADRAALAARRNTPRWLTLYDWVCDNSPEMITDRLTAAYRQTDGHRRKIRAQARQLAEQGATIDEQRRRLSPHGSSAAGRLRRFLADTAANTPIGEALDEVYSHPTSDEDRQALRDDIAAVLDSLAAAYAMLRTAMLPTTPEPARIVAPDPTWTAPRDETWLLHEIIRAWGYGAHADICRHMIDRTRRTSSQVDATTRLRRIVERTTDPGHPLAVVLDEVYSSPTTTEDDHALIADIATVLDPTGPRPAALFDTADTADTPD